MRVYEESTFRKALVDAFRPQVAAIAQELVPADHVDAGAQVGLLGVLHAFVRTGEPELALALDGCDLANAPLFVDLALGAARRRVAAWRDESTYYRRRPRSA